MISEIVLADHVTSETDPEGGVTSWTYDLAGNLVSETDADDNETTYE